MACAARAAGSTTLLSPAFRCQAMQVSGPSQPARTPHARGSVLRAAAAAPHAKIPALALRALLLAAACAAAQAQLRPGGASRGNRGGAIGVGVAILVVIVACCVGCCFRRQLRAWWEGVRPRPAGAAVMEILPTQHFAPHSVSGTVVGTAHAAASAPGAVLVVPNPLAASLANEAAVARARENLVLNDKGVWVPRDAAAL